MLNGGFVITPELGPNGSDCGIVNVNIGPSGAEIGGTAPYFILFHVMSRFYEIILGLPQVPSVVRKRPAVAVNRAVIPGSSTCVGTASVNHNVECAALTY